MDNSPEPANAAAGGAASGAVGVGDGAVGVVAGVVAREANGLGDVEKETVWRTTVSLARISIVTQSDLH